MSTNRGPGRGERARLAICFGLLGAVPVFLAAWLAWVQVLGLGRLSRGPDRPPLRLTTATPQGQKLRSEQLPAPRGTIVDCKGRLLAVDCESYEVRLEVNADFPALRRRPRLRAFLLRIAGEIAGILARDPEAMAEKGFRDRVEQRLRRRLLAAFRFDGRGEDRPPPKRADVLVHTDVAALPVIAALRELDRRQDAIHLHWLHGFRRLYPDREATYGVVGYVDYFAVHEPGAHGAIYRRLGAFGMERLVLLGEGEPGRRRFLVDSRARPFWAGPPQPPEPAGVLECTIDLELQKAAVRELDRAVRIPAEQGGPPKWGALVLVEIASGDVLAMASWHRDVAHQKGTRVTAYQSVCEPGSVVKPLVLAMARERAGLDWSRPIDCAPTLPRLGWDNGYGRIIRDDHRCGVLTPHDILVESSNIGAVKIGMTMPREVWREYLGFYQFGQSVDLRLGGERVGGPGGDLDAPDRRFWRDTAPSLSFGYELNVSPLQLTRAYLNLLSGSRRKLRLYRALVHKGVRIELPPAPPGPRVLSEANVQAVVAALVDVVRPDEHATGRHLHALLQREQGLDVHGLIAGKSGTAVSRVGIGGGAVAEVRNASFVAFAPAGRPRYLAVCVLQRDSTARFYGGSYAAPPVGRLLLHALREDEGARLRRKPQVSATPGGSGWGLLASESETGR